MPEVRDETAKLTNRADLVDSGFDLRNLDQLLQKREAEVADANAPIGMVQRMILERANATHLDNPASLIFSNERQSSSRSLIVAGLWIR